MILTKTLHSFSIGSTVAVQLEDGVPWIHGMVIEGHSDDHQEQSY